MSASQLAVTVVTVTYGDRWAFLSQVLAALPLDSPAVREVIVVDNGADVDIAARVGSQFLEKCRVINLGRNTGSARGFARGIECALAAQAELILLLDDDNVLEPDGIYKLLATYRALGSDRQNVLTCLREDRKEYAIAASEGRMRTDKHAFLGFSVFEKMGRWISVRSTQRARVPLIPSDRAPYGGTMFNAEAIAKAGLPDERLVLYFDDYEFFWRLRNSGARIFLCASIAIADVDTSWNRTARRGHYLFSAHSSEDKAFYVVRNSMYLARRQGLSSLFVLNAALYVALSLAKTLVAERNPMAALQRSNILWRAFRDGMTGRLGARHERNA